MSDTLQIQGLSARRGGLTLFEELAISVKQGEHVVIVGDSGSGKSTLLHSIAEHPTVTHRAAMVLQEGALLRRLSVLENLQLVARYRNTNSAAPNLLEKLNIDPVLHQADVNYLSGGQQRRVAIARGLMCQPEVLLFDEPDAGLDVANLGNLAAAVNQSAEQCACVTVSHNPIYIAQVANRVLRLRSGALELLCEWSNKPASEAELLARQQELQIALSADVEVISGNSRSGGGPKVEWVFPLWLIGIWQSLISLFHWPKSWRDTLSTSAYTVQLSCLTGLIFFGLVGLMLGSTTIAVVRLLADNALTGFIGFFIKPDDLLAMMGGVYVLYLAPPIGAMLFAARSGSLVCNWLGELVRSRQVLALERLHIDTKQYLRSPATVAMFLGMVASLIWFSLAVWLGGLIAVNQLFTVADPATILQISNAEIHSSSFFAKLGVYSAIVATTVVGLGLSNKSTAHHVNTHTTKSIIYSTLVIALLELLVILAK